MQDFFMDIHPLESGGCVHPNSYIEIHVAKYLTPESKAMTEVANSLVENILEYKLT